MISEKYIIDLFDKYYKNNPELLRIVLCHSRLVASKALNISKKLNLSLEDGDVFAAAMLHDIGVVKCYAPDIHAFGKEPYICHGIEGKKILDENGLFNYSSICERHTGAGLTKEEIVRQGLPLPKQDMTPKTLLEKLICYADKFYSKSRDLEKEKSIAHIEKQMKKHGAESFKRFKDLHSLFSFERQDIE